MTENENQDASSKKGFKTRDNDGLASWSDLDHDMLLLIMMRLGVVDFREFGGVCKSWRFLALSKKIEFMASRPPMKISIPDEPNEEDYHCHLEDTEGRSFNSILPNSGGRTCIGFTCGHLILFGKETNDLWLLDPVIRHGLHFPNIPSSVSDDPKRIRGILNFSPSISGWVFVMINGSTNIWFSKAGQGEWNHVSSTAPIVDIHAFKGKLYAIEVACNVYELILDLEPKLTLLETKNCPNFPIHAHSICCDNLFAVRCLSEDAYELHKLDFKEMKWVLMNNNTLKHSAAVDHGKGKTFLWKYMAYPMTV